MSTNKLTWRELEAMCAGPNAPLKRWEVRGGRPPAAGRGLYALTDIYTRILERPWPAASEDRSPRVTVDRRNAMLAVMERFAMGHALVIRRDMKELGTMKSDQSLRGWWEFRSQGPMTETRLFGFFARPGAFVGVAFSPRDELGDHDDPAWNNKFLECLTAWNRLTGSRPYQQDPWPMLLRRDLHAYTDGASDD